MAKEKLTSVKVNENSWNSFKKLSIDEKITVNPGGQLSYQYHKQRSEVWTIVSGNATLTLDDKISHHTYGETIQIPVGTKHRVENKSLDPLVFIEVQWGGYFGEDDIIRIEDKYNRK